MKHTIYNRKRGFTLVEAMVAISILSLSITAPLLIAQKGIGSAIYAKDQITAFYLAQEGVEYIRNVRDMNRIANVSWLTNLTPCIDTGAGERCVVDSSQTNPNNANAITSCGASCQVIAFDPANKIYGYGAGWSPTKFTRSVRMEQTGGDEALVAVTISWKTNLFNPIREFTVREYLFNY